MRQWTALQWSYEGNPRFRHETLSRYLPPEAVARIEGETQDSLAPRSTGTKGDWPSWLTWIAAAVALLLLVIVVRRRGAARSRTQGAASDSGQVALPRGYADFSEADRQLLTRASLELLDSLEPYLYAAQIDGAPLPIEVLRDAAVRGHFMAYSRAALKLEGATDEDIKRMTPSLLFHLLLVAPQRMKHLFRAGASPPTLPAEITERELGTETFRGFLEGTLALKLFELDTAKSPIQTDAVDEEIPLELAEEAARHAAASARTPRRVRSAPVAQHVHGPADRGVGLSAHRSNRSSAQAYTGPARSPLAKGGTMKQITRPTHITKALFGLLLCAACTAVVAGEASWSNADGADLVLCLHVHGRAHRVRQRGVCTQEPWTRL